MHEVKFLVLFLVCLKNGYLCMSRHVRCIESERKALLSVKQGLIDDHGVLSSWGGSYHDMRDCCIWNGVFCSNTTHRVIALRLASSKLSGTVFHHLGNLTSLRTLDLSWNMLRFDNLNWLSSLNFLSQLDLSNGYISDANWLHHILRIRSLQELHLIRCFLSDVIPSSTLFSNSSSSSLSVLDLSDNGLMSSTFDWLFNISSTLVDLDLSDNYFDGQIPNAFGDMVSLESLDLSYNNFAGEIPKSLKNLEHLQSLILSHNLLSGQVPNLTSCVLLKELRLQSNMLEGSFESFSQISKLETLDVSFNYLKGMIHELDFAKLGDLKKLDISYNALTMKMSQDWNPPFQLDALVLACCRIGIHFPAWIQTQKSLSILDLSHAGIAGEVPKWLWTSPTKLTHLNISHNHFVGTIPDISSKFISTLDASSNNFWGLMPNLHPNISAFLISQNKFSGSISSICARHEYKFIKLLDISNNEFSGELPDCWNNMSSLILVNLGNNKFHGKLPHSLGSLGFLKALHLGGNDFSGNLPWTLKKCRYLQLIDVSGNKLNGTIPKWIGDYSMTLKFLIFRDNRFHGTIPQEICHLTQMQVLDISRNNIFGEIPECFNRFSSFVQKNGSIGNSIRIPFTDNMPPCNRMDRFKFDYLVVRWKGQDLEYEKTLGLVKLIDLSGNKLVGRIPPQLFSLKGLISLNLSRNNLIGNIHPNIGEMEMLESLDLSRNRLSGEIPFDMARLHYLQVLDLSYNKLFGRIPSSTQLQSFNSAVYAGNMDLCGQPLVSCRVSATEMSSSILHGEGKGCVSLSLIQEFGISMVFGYIFGFWGFVGSMFFNKSWRRTYFTF